MEKRFLGRSGLQVSSLSFGLLTFGDGKGQFSSIGDTRDDNAQRQIDLAIEAGVNLFDTADAYSRGRSEQILGAALGQKRKQVLIATKAFGLTGKGEHDLGLSRRHIIAACEASLKRLNTDWIDLYQVHNFDSLVPVEETLRALDDLVGAGKVRYIGCSNHFGWQLTKALGLSERLNRERYISQQIQYSLLVRDAETEMLPAGIDQGVGALIYSPLAQGYLTGKFSRGVPANTRLSASEKQLAAFDSSQGRAIVGTLLEIAAEHEQATASQVALSWLLTRPGVSSVIVGSRTEQQLQDNLLAADLCLSERQLERLDKVSRQPTPYPRAAQNIFHPERNPSVFPRYS